MFLKFIVLFEKSSTIIIASYLNLGLTACPPRSEPFPRVTTTPWKGGAETGDPSESVQGEGVTCCLRPGDTAPEHTLTCALDSIRDRIQTVRKSAIWWQLTFLSLVLKFSSQGQPSVRSSWALEGQVARVPCWPLNTECSKGFLLPFVLFVYVYVPWNQHFRLALGTWIF